MSAELGVRVMGNSRDKPSNEKKPPPPIKEAAAKAKQPGRIRLSTAVKEMPAVSERPKGRNGLRFWRF